VAQQKPTGSKTAPNSRANKPTSAPPPRKPVERYTVKQEFWESLLNSLPPWGDEIAAIVLFVLILAYLAVTGLLSSTGVDHAWPYPSK